MLLTVMTRGYWEGSGGGGSGKSSGGQREGCPLLDNTESETETLIKATLRLHVIESGHTSD